nr:pyridoxine 5'-phosphate oxidase C-terminal domain-containing protein [Frankia sp. AgPm24]
MHAVQEPWSASWIPGFACGDGIPSGAPVCGPTGVEHRQGSGERVGLAAATAGRGRVRRPGGAGRAVEQGTGLRACQTRRGCQRGGVEHPDLLCTNAGVRSPKERDSIGSVTEVEFFQGDALRRDVRLRYRREGATWTRELLWP